MFYYYGAKRVLAPHYPRPRYRTVVEPFAGSAQYAARCVMGHELIILDDDPAFCPDCGHDVMPVGACRVVQLCGERIGGGKCVMRAGHSGPHGQVGLR